MAALACVNVVGPQFNVLRVNKIISLQRSVIKKRGVLIDFGYYHCLSER